MIKADVTIAEQRQVIDVPVTNESDAIRVLWNTYGAAIKINRWIETEEKEEVEDEQIDSNEPDDTGESDRASGNPQGDVLQADE